MDGKLDDVNRLAAELYRDTGCVCKLETKAEKILVNIDYYGVLGIVETFNVLFRNLSKGRLSMSCSLGSGSGVVSEQGNVSFTDQELVCIGEGDEMIDRMKSAVYSINKKEYYWFLKILCGIERVD